LEKKTEIEKLARMEAQSKRIIDTVTAELESFQKVQTEAEQRVESSKGFGG